MRIRVVFSADEMCCACSTDHGFPNAQPRVTAHHETENTGPTVSLRAHAENAAFFAALTDPAGERAKNIAFFDTIAEPRGAYAIVDYQRVLAMASSYTQLGSSASELMSSPTAVFGTIGVPWDKQIGVRA